MAGKEISEICCWNIVSLWLTIFMASSIREKADDRKYSNNSIF